MARTAGKVAVVTGGALGIGAATCAMLAREGAAVAITDVLEKEGQALAERIRADGGKAQFWALDVTDEAAVERVFNEVVNTFGKLDVLVNNAGIAGASKPTHELTAEEWDKVINVNVRGVFFCTKHAVPHMRRAGSGSIINLSSIYGIIGAPDLPPYHASKGAVRLMTKTDALLYAKDKIRVNSVHPGYLPPMEGGSLHGILENKVPLTPMRRIGQPIEVAHAILFLASDEASFITGAELVVDGGFVAQ